MAINLIGNQLVKMYSVEDFNQRNKRLTWDYRTYCQVVREEQTTMFQLQVTEQTGEDIVNNGDFISNLSSWHITFGSPTSWTWVSGRARAQISGATVVAMATSVNLDANSYYLIEFNIDEMSDGVQVIVNIDPTPDYGNGQAIGVTTSGTHQFYFSSGASISGDIYLTVSGDNGDVCYFDYVKMVKYTNPVVTVEDCQGVTKRILTPTQAQDIFNYSIDWFGLTEGCYRVCINGIDDLTYNYLDYALALGTEGGAPLLQYEGGFIKWYG